MSDLTSELVGWSVAAFCWENVEMAWASCIIINIHYLNPPSSFSLAQPRQKGANELHDNMLPHYCFEIMQLFLPARLFLDNWLQNIRQLFLKTNYPPPLLTTKVIFHTAIMNRNQCSDVDVCWWFFFFLSLPHSCSLSFSIRAWRLEGGLSLARRALSWQPFECSQWRDRRWGRECSRCSCPEPQEDGSQGQT